MSDMLTQKTVVQKNVVDAHRELQEWHASDEGKAMVESIAPAGTMSKDEFMDHAKQHVTTLGEQPDTLRTRRRRRNRTRLIRRRDGSLRRFSTAWFTFRC